MRCFPLSPHAICLETILIVAVIGDAKQHPGRPCALDMNREKPVRGRCLQMLAKTILFPNPPPLHDSG